MRKLRSPMRSSSRTRVAVSPSLQWAFTMPMTWRGAEERRRGCREVKSHGHAAPCVSAPSQSLASEHRGALQPRSTAGPDATKR